MADELGLKVAVEQRIALFKTGLQYDPVVAQVRKAYAADAGERHDALACCLWPLVDEVRYEDVHGARRDEQEAGAAHGRATEP